MVPPAQQIRQQKEYDLHQVANTIKEAWANDLLATDLALHTLQLNMNGI